MAILHNKEKTLHVPAPNCKGATSGIRTISFALQNTLLPPSHHEKIRYPPCCSRLPGWRGLLSATLQPRCGIAAATQFAVVENPVHTTLVLSATLRTPTTLCLRLVDARGWAVRSLPAQAVARNSLMRMDVAGLAAGIYYLTVLDAGGALLYRQKVVANPWCALSHVSYRALLLFIS